MTVRTVRHWSPPKLHILWSTAKDTADVETFEVGSRIMNMALRRLNKTENVRKTNVTLRSVGESFLPWKRACVRVPERLVHVALLIQH